MVKLNLKLLKLEEIVFDETLYPRTIVDWHTIVTYKRAMQAGSKFPPIVVVKVKNSYLLIDGKHRLEAYTQLKQSHITSEVIEKKLSRTELFAEAIKRNITNARPLSFYEKLVAFKRLTKEGLTLKQVEGVLHIPEAELTKYKSERFTIAATGKEVPLKATVKNLGGTDAAITPEEQKIYSGRTQLQLIKELNHLIKTKRLDTENTEIEEALRELKENLLTIHIEEVA